MGFRVLFKGLKGSFKGFIAPPIGSILVLFWGYLVTHSLHCRAFLGIAL